MNKSKRILTGVLATTLITGMTMGTVTFARSSKRAAWNDASGSKTQSTTLNTYCDTDGTESGENTVYSNVYADSEKWEAWKTEWTTVSRNYEQIALTPGINESQLNFAWYSLTKETPKVRLLDENGTLIKEFTGTQNADNAETVVEGESSITLYPNKVTVTDLKESTSYKYQYYLDGAWSPVYDYKTQSTEKFTMLYVGDPQIGASKGQTTAAGNNENAEYYAMNDAYNWQNTLANAIAANENLAFILSAGDQINQTKVDKDSEKLQQQIEYAGFLSSPVLRSIPIATTIGNHDSKSLNYSNHYNNPNTADTAETTAGASIAGTDYYFRYGNALFVSIDTNNYNCSTHENVIKEAVENNKDATWKILMFHQDIYGSGYDHSDTDGIILRTQLTPIIDKYDFDAVLQGHDHTYSRTYQLGADGETHNSYSSNPNPSSDEEGFAEFLEDNNCYDILTGKSDGTKVVDPEGTVYFEANSSTGSKFYQLIAMQQDYIAARSQSWRPTYSVIEITDVTLTVKTYDAATNEELVADGGIETSYTIVKEADKTSLDKEIESAKSQYDNAVKSGKYTEESLKNLNDVIELAEKISENAEASNTDIASAVTSLQEAADALAEKETEETEIKTDNSEPEDIETGDSSKTAVIATEFGLAFISLAGIIVLAYSEKKKVENND